jgi:hypothetical protein
MLASTTNVRRLFQGAAPVTYVLLGLGALLFINGLLGWMGSYKRGGCMLKMFLFLCVLTIAAEIGGIIALSILKAKVTDIVEQSWLEMNLKSQHIIQEQLECCGLSGPSEFAKNADPIDSSCYHTLNTSELSRDELSTYNSTASDLRVLNKNGCKDKLVSWISKHRIYWIASFGGFLLFQVFTVLLAVSAVNHLKSRSSSMESLDDMHTTTYM